jgi:hypothetical protein
MVRNIAIWIILILLEATVISLFLSKTWLYEQITNEREQTIEWLGHTTSEKIIQRADSTYTWLFKDSGVMNFTYDLFLPDQRAVDSRAEFNRLSEYVDFFGGRLDAFWTSVYQSVQRYSLFVEWLPYLLPFLIPCLIDGLMNREIKKTNYGYTNPVRYHAAMHALIALFFLPIIYMFFPIAINPIIIPFWIFVVGSVAMILTANIQKQL